MAERVVRAVLTGSSAGAVRAFEETAVAADASGNSIARSAEASSARQGSAWSSLGATAVKVAAAATAVGVGVAIVAVKMAGDFQQATTALVTGAGESAKNIDMIRQGLLQLAPIVGTTPTELAKGLYYIESAGYHGAAALQVLKVSAEGAKVGMADQATVADALTTALNDYHLGALSASNVMNELTMAVSVGKTKMQDFAGSLGTVLPIASSLHVPMEQITAAISTMTTQGTDAATASQSLRFMLAALAGPTSAATKEFQGMGVGMSEIPGITAATGKALKDLGLKTDDVASTLGKTGLAGALEEITTAISKKFPAGSAEYEAALKGAVGGTRGLTAALELTGQNTAIFEGNIQKIALAAGGAGAAVTGWADVQNDFNFKMQQAHAALSVVAITIGNFLLPVVTTLAGWFAGMLPTALKVVTAAFTWLNINVFPTLVNAFKTIVQWVTQNRTVLLGIAETAGKVVVGAFTVLGDAIGFIVRNFQIFGPLLVSVVAGFVAFKAAMMIQALIQGVSMGLFMFQAGLAGVSVAEVGATSTSFALGAAIDFMLGPIGLTILAIAAIIAIGVLLVTHWQMVVDKAKEVFGHIHDLVVGVVDAIGDHIGGFVNVLVNIFKATPFGFLVTHLHELFDVVVAVFGAIVGRIEIIFGVIASVVSAVVNRIGIIFSVAIPIISAVFGVIVTVIGDALSVIVPVVSAIVGRIGVIIGVIATVFADTFGVLAAIVSTAIGVVVGIISTAVTVISNIWGVLSTVFRVAFQVVATTIAVPFVLIIGIIQGVVTAITDVVENFVGVVSVVVGALAPIFRSAFGVIAMVVGTAINGIEVIVRAVIGPISVVVKAIAAVFTVEFNIIKTVVGAVIGAIVAVIRAVAGPVGAVVKAITTVFTIEFNIIKTVVTTIIGVIVTVIQGIVGVVQAVVGTVVSVFQAIAGPIAAVFTGIVSVVSTIIGGIAKAWSTVVNGFASVLQAVAGPVGAAINVVIGAAKGVIDGVIDAINFVIGVIDAIQVHIHFGPVSMDWNGLNIPKIPQLMTGGVITSQGLGWLHPAEVVVSRDAQIEAMNAGKGDTYTNHITINVTGGDPQAIVNALKRYMYASGSIPVTVAAAKRVA